MTVYVGAYDEADVKVYEVGWARMCYKFEFYLRWSILGAVI